MLQHPVHFFVVVSPSQPREHSMGVPECSVGKVKTMLGHGHTSPGSCEAPNWANEGAKFRHGLAILDLRHKKVRRSDSAPFVALQSQYSQRSLP